VFYVTLKLCIPHVMVTESSDARFEPSEYLNRSRHYKNVMQNYCKLICMIILY